MNEQLVVILIISYRVDRYSAIKEAMCSIENAVPTQCVVAKTIEDEGKLRSVCTKIIQQIESKVGGELWKVLIPQLDDFKVFLGITVTASKSVNTPSSVSFVAYTKKKDHLAHFFAKTSFSSSGAIAENLGLCVREVLSYYYHVLQRFPSEIVIYRDGVSDSQENSIKERVYSISSSSFSVPFAMAAKWFFVLFSAFAISLSSLPFLFFPRFLLVLWVDTLGGLFTASKSL
jgi:aubergine-like protein